MSKEEMREGFEAWHCEQYKTKHMTGAPTRDMHNGVRDENYCSKKSQALWECWQETGGDVAKVEALKEAIERIEAGKDPVAVLYKDGTVLTKEECGTAFDICCYMETPLFTRSDAGEVKALRDELATVRKVAAGNMELLDRLTAAEQRNAELESLLRRSSELLKQADFHMTAGDIDAVLKPTESGASE